MLKLSFTLIDKTALTHDVYELIYNAPDMLGGLPLPGQYVMFQLSPGVNRAYSISDFDNTKATFTLIVKRIADGKGSPLICDAPIGTLFHGMISLGHFVLRDTPRSKCFIGTGTGFAPLFCQMKHITLADRISFIFGVRQPQDSFYEEEILSLGKGFSDFRYVRYFSRGVDITSSESTTQNEVGYVTDWITQEHTSEYEEYYICGSPAMVKSAREKLESLGIAKDDIYWEQF